MTLRCIALYAVFIIVNPHFFWAESTLLTPDELALCIHSPSSFIQCVQTKTDSVAVSDVQDIFENQIEPVLTKEVNTHQHDYNKSVELCLVGFQYYSFHDQSGLSKAIGSTILTEMSRMTAKTIKDDPNLINQCEVAYLIDLLDKMKFSPVRPPESDALKVISTLGEGEYSYLISRVLTRTSILQKIILTFCGMAFTIGVITIFKYLLTRVKRKT